MAEKKQDERDMELNLEHYTNEAPQSCIVLYKVYSSQYTLFIIFNLCCEDSKVLAVLQQTPYRAPSVSTEKLLHQTLLLLIKPKL